MTEQKLAELNKSLDKINFLKDALGTLAKGGSGVTQIKEYGLLNNKEIETHIRKLTIPLMKAELKRLETHFNDA